MDKKDKKEAIEELSSTLEEVLEAEGFHSDWVIQEAVAKLAKLVVNREYDLEDNDEEDEEELDLWEENESFSEDEE